MSARNAILFDAGKPTLALRLQWTDKGGQAPPAGFVALESDLSATLSFRLFWEQQFPTRDPLPYGALAEPDGRGSDAFWDVFE